MRCAFLIAWAAIAGSLASAAPTESVVSLLARMPAVPADAQAAYSQWKDVHGSIDYGPSVLALRKELRAAGDAGSTRRPRSGPKFSPRQRTSPTPIRLVPMRTQTCPARSMI